MRGCKIKRNIYTHTHIHQSFTVIVAHPRYYSPIITEKANLSKDRLSFNSILLEQTARIFTSGTVWSTDCKAKV